MQLTTTLTAVATTATLLSSTTNADVGDICGYAPLCGSASTTFDWVTGDSIPIDGDLIGGAEIQFTDCCSLRDTEPLESCQIVDPSGESYRYATSTDAVCGNNQANCNDGQCSEYQLVIKPSFESSSQSEGCCASCTCYGDPQCTSFDGTSKTWVLCDGREIPNADSIWDMCRITERRCLKEKDHAGNTCVYLAEDDRGRGWEVGKLGSPCIPNPSSPASYITMYEVPSQDFKLTLQQGERGIIQQVILELSCGDFTLSAERCLLFGSDGWTHSTDELPEIFSYNPLVHGRDVVWNVVDPDTGIAINLRCHANYFADDDGIYVARINVEDLSDPRPNRNNVGGFCATNNFDVGQATTEHTDKINAGEYCKEGLQESELRDVYRAICKNPALPQSGIEDCQYHFCNKHFSPLYQSIAECEEAMQNDVAEGFCRGVVYTESDVKKCVDQWYELGSTETIQQYYDDEAGCLEQWQTSLEDCQSGVIIQYRRNNGEWADEIAIPDNFCGSDDQDGEIRLSYCDHPRLFERVIRIVQKQASIACSPTNQCTRVDGFRGFVGLVKDTPAPTPFPSAAPTPAPTNGPTPFPTVAPTPFPVTPYPTLSPINTFPTSFPTQSPVRTQPTVFPTAEPTEALTPPPYCPQPPLCGDENSQTPLNENENGVTITMEGCCPTDFCNTNYYPDQNRTKETTQGYCQGDESLTGRDCADDFELELQVSFAADESCCRTCTCFGDPRCYTFSGDFQEFILCDGRTAPESGSSDDRCVIRRDTCEAQRDHEGNACRWYVPDRPGIVPNYDDPDRQYYEEGKFEVMKYGSPCRYDADAVDTPPIMLLYSTDDYEVEVEQGDRGYIVSVILTVSNGEFEMTADRCLAGREWEVLSGEAEFKQFKTVRYADEYVWTVIDALTGIELVIRCTGVTIDGKYTNKFINVEQIADPNFERAQNGLGVCSTNVIQERALATWQHTEELNEQGLCEQWNKGMTEIMLRDVVRIITNNPGTTQTGTANAYKQFCQKYYAPGYTSVSKCTNAFLNAKDVSALNTAFCRSVTYNNRAECEEQMEMWSSDSGYHGAFLLGYENYIENFEEECVLDPKDVPETLNFDDCETGVELQWFSTRKNEWLPYAAFSATSGPCSSYTVRYNYNDDPKLFKYNLRLVQRHSFATCSSCTYAAGVTMSMRFIEP